METKNLTESLRAFKPADWEWKFALYAARKSRDGIDLDWSLCKMKGVAKWVETLRDALLEKTLAERTVTEYSPFLPKESIPALPREDGLIREQLWDTVKDIQSGLEYAPENYANGDVTKPTGYGFYGFRKDEDGKISDEALFMRRVNPFLTGSKAWLCTTVGSEIVTADKPVLKFMPATDFLLFGGVCYFLSTAIEKDFDLENRNAAVAAKRMELLGEACIVSSFEQLEKAAYAAKNARKFVDFDKHILAHIVRLTVEDREEFLLKYGVTIDQQGRMDTYDPEQCELIIDLLCGRSCLDAFGRLAVGSNITVRE
ncbi:hypothetical protein FACS189492_1680 [Clostridia bacterium]|nr:hypothetical protein FACS189492_1680 [Clostridia bacterium]